MSGRPDLVNAADIHRFVTVINTVAARALDGATDPGLLQMTILHPSGSAMVPTRYPIGAVDLMVEQAISSAGQGFNVYVEGRTVLARATGRGDLEATRGVFGLVDDSDADKGKEGELSIEPCMVVETSPGNYHRWLFLDRALTAGEAQLLGPAIRAATRSDSATAKPTQPYRVAGTPNYPGAQKLARGRIVTPTRLLYVTNHVWSATELANAFPPIATAIAVSPPRGRTGRPSRTVEAIVAEIGADRSGRFFRAVGAAIRAGLLPDDLEHLMRQHPEGCASKYRFPDRLRTEIERAWAKIAETTPPDIDPTYPDRAVPVDEARRLTDRAIADHLATLGVTHQAIKTSTGVGKTQIAARRMALHIRTRMHPMGDERPVVYAVPRHQLGDEVAALFDAEGVTARVFRGRNAENPDMPGERMCLDLTLVRLALSLGESVSTACCAGEDPRTKTKQFCPFYSRCRYQAQLRLKPDVWIVPHQLLFQGQAGLGAVARIVVDEGFWQAGIIEAGRGLTLDEIADPPPLKGKLDDLADVAAYRPRLARALRRQEALGGVARRHLIDEGLDAETCTSALAAEWRLKTAATVWPDMDAPAREAAAQAARTAARIRSYAALWKAARDLLLIKDPAVVSGRLVLAKAQTREGTVRVARTRGLRSIAADWSDVPTLLLDATLPDPAITKRFYPQMTTAADIEARMPHARVRQLLGAPTSMSKLLGSQGERNLNSIRRAILFRFVEAGRRPTLVIAQQKVVEWLRVAGLPQGIDTAHFNAISGLDGYKSISLLIVVGRTLPNVVEVEDTAGAIVGIEVRKTRPSENGGPRWYDKATRGLRLAEGGARAVEGDIHPDTVAEAVRWQVCEGELIQAVGRARGANRTDANRVDIELWNDVALPLSVDEVARWDDVPSGREADMLIDGVVLGSPADMATCWPALWPTEEAARKARVRGATGQDPIETIIYGEMSACSFRYRHVGQGQKWRRGWHDPSVAPDPRAWIEARLQTRLADFQLEKHVRPVAPVVVTPVMKDRGVVCPTEQLDASSKQEPRH